MYATFTTRKLSYLKRLISTSPSLKAKVDIATEDGQKKYVFGCGSNVVDNIYNVRVVPQAGEKGFFLSPFKALEAKLIGGVTLNHLCWAALGGVPTGMLALQGNDDQGQFIRTKLKKMGVSTDFIKIDDHYTTAECHVFIQEDGERSILMAPAATFLINAKTARESFERAIKEYASMVTTEISQVPFSGVLEVLKMAKEAGVLSILDLDVPPAAAINEAKLGEMDELLECLNTADILKPAKAAAVEVLQVLGKQLNGGDLMTAATELIDKCGSKMIAITDGASGSILATHKDIIKVEATKLDKVIDTTGAGDAFLGGLIVGISKFGFPGTSTELQKLGKIANAFGAAGVQSVGGVPVPTSKRILQGYLPQMEFGGGFISNQLTGFTQSLEKDALVANNILSSIERQRNNWTNFLAILENCEGQVFTSGIGKSGHVASRLASSLSSIGVSSQYVHASEWKHGDLGKLHPGKDVCIFISHSGSTSETIRAASQVLAKGVTPLAITAVQESPLNKLCLDSLIYNDVKVEEPFDCLPSTSLIIQEMLCNALVCELIARRGVSKEDYASNHPGGAIGKKLQKAT